MGNISIQLEHPFDHVKSVNGACPMRFPQAEGRRLEAIEKDVNEKREKLQRIKRQRDTVKLENKTLKLTSGLVTQPELLHDMEAQKELADTLKEKVSVQSLGFCARV